MRLQPTGGAAEEARLEQAAEWFVSLQGGDGSDLPADELKRWEHWIAEPANHAAFDRMASIWVESGALERPALPRVRRFSPAVAVAAVLVLGLATGAAIYWLSPDYETGRGEHREIRLSDGSTVTLGASTALSVRYTDEHRILELDRGEALFTAARDAARPFVVKAGKGTITALGTAFNVLRNSDRVTVTVTDGKVEVRSKDRQTPAQLERGEQVAYSEKGNSGIVAAADPVQATAWRDGRLWYRHEPLRRVIEDVNRYAQRRIAVDPAVADLEFTGVVFRDQIPQWTQGLKRIFPVRIVEEGADRLAIVPREDR